MPLRASSTALRVIEIMPSLSATSWMPSASQCGTIRRRIAGVAGDVRAGGGAWAQAMLADCDASREREVRYAAAKGLTATR